MVPQIVKPYYQEQTRIQIAIAEVLHTYLERASSDVYNCKASNGHRRGIAPRTSSNCSNRALINRRAFHLEIDIPFSPRMCT